MTTSASTLAVREGDGPGWKPRAGDGSRGRWPERALRFPFGRIVASGERIWVITEADRSVTTFLLPSEY